MLPVKVEAGILCADEPLNVTVAEALLASIFPNVRLILPFIFKVLLPTTRVPLFSVNMPDRTRLLFKL